MEWEFKTEARQLDYELVQEGPEVELHYNNCPQLFAHHLKTVSFQSTFPIQIMKSYTASSSSAKWTFSHREVLSHVDHQPLLDFVSKFMESFMVYQVEYRVPQLEKPVEALLHQMDEQREIIAFEIIKEKNTKELTMLVSKENRDLLKSKFEKLKEYKSEELIFPLDDYLQGKKLKPSEHDPFLRGLLKHFKNIIIGYVCKRMKKLNLDNEATITDICCLEGQLQRKVNIKKGVVFKVIGFGEKFGKLYQFVEKWFEKFNWIVLEVVQIECCKRSKLEDYLLRVKLQKGALLSYKPKGKNQDERVVIYAPKEEKSQLEQDLLTATRLISGKEFSRVSEKGEDCFYLLFKYQSDFKKFLNGQKGGQTNYAIKIYRQYLVMRSNKEGEARVRKKIKEFLELYQEEEVRIEEFKSMFHIQIFKHYYSSMIRTKPIKIQLIEGKLYRCNSRQKSEQVQNEIKQIYKAMRKELIFKPLSRPLSRKLEDVEVTLAPPQWMTPECLESRRYKVTDKLLVYLRSYASIFNSDADCIFLVQDFKLCHELKDILEEEEGSSKFEENLKKNKKMSMPLRYCRYFDNITVWLLEKERYRQRRNSNNDRRLKSQIEGLIGSSSNPLQLQIMLPCGSEEVLDIFMPTLLDTLIQSCKFDSSKAVKELTIYTSSQGGDAIRKEVIEQLRRFNRIQPVDRITDLDLRLPDLEKILQYKYLELKYFEDNTTKSATPLNSYIFSREFLKKGKTPIFLPTEGEKRCKEYLVSYFSGDIWEVSGSEVVRLKRSVKEVEELSALVDLVKTYFPMVDYVVFVGNADSGVFSKRLVYTDCKESLYKTFEELNIDLKNSKILLKNNGVRLKYELVENEFLELYRAEIHPAKAAQLPHLKNLVFL